MKARMRSGISSIAMQTLLLYFFFKSMLEHIKIYPVFHEVDNFEDPSHFGVDDGEY